MRYELNRFHSRKNPKRYSFEGRVNYHRLKPVACKRLRRTKQLD
jgi:hypothetical protein